MSCHDCLHLCVCVSEDASVPTKIGWGGGTGVRQVLVGVEVVVGSSVSGSDIYAINPSPV